jgi:hypothetical protein
MIKKYLPGVLLLVAGMAQAQVGPTPNSAAAATATAQDNDLCTGIEPYYWEIGDASGPLLSASQGVDENGDPVTATTSMDVASSAKWLYGIYLVQVRGSAANLTPTDINFLHMTSGYTNMGGSQHPAGTCPSSDSPDTVNTCLTLLNPVDDLPNNYQDPATTGFFDYDGGHIQNHGGLYSPIGNVVSNKLGAVISAKLGPGVKIIYSQPLLPGGVYTTPSQFGLVLSHIVSGILYMHDALGTSPVCTQSSDACAALNSPIPEAWHYSISHWIEDDPKYHGDGAFSAPGGQGFYPWVEASKNYYGLIGRATTGPNKQGFQSVQCGRLIRRAWDTGKQQTGRLPTK